MTDIFKLIFEHDLRLDKLKERNSDRNSDTRQPSLEDFLKPDPTYSKFYITGTQMQEQSFGLNRLSAFNQVRRALRQVIDGRFVIVNGTVQTIDMFLDDVETGVPAVIGKEEKTIANFPALIIDKESNIGHRKEELSDVLKTGDWVLYKESNHHGYDLHLFSKENIYSRLFYPFRELVSEDFRFFSMNGKRITSERKFYFETWTLQRPPHGAEEVFADTEL